MSTETATDLWGNPVPERPVIQKRSDILLLPKAERADAIRAWESSREARGREQRRAREQARWAAGNPCLKLYGAGPAHRTCATCAHLITKKFAGTYFKCSQRKNSNAASTDHRKTWPACAKYHPLDDVDESPVD